MTRWRIIQKHPSLYALQRRSRWWPFWSDLYYSSSVEWLMTRQAEWLRNGEVVAS